MTLIQSISIAVSGMKTTQEATKIVSNNIANSDVDGYTRKIATTETITAAGSGAGVQSTVVQNLTDKNLMRSAVTALTASSAADVTNSYLDQLQTALGSTDGESSLAAAVESISTALSSLSATPEGQSESDAVVSSAKTVILTMSTLSDSIQTLRGDADRDIGQSVEEINGALRLIDTLNTEIARSQAMARSTADLEDQRNTAVQTIAENIGISYYTDDSNRMRIYTTNGINLLDTNVHELSYTPSYTVNSTATWPADLSGISVDGVDVTAKLKTGEIGSLLALRDETLVNAQAELDQFAVTLKEALNDAHNLGTANPPQTTLTGSTVVSASDIFSGSGSVRVAILDKEGLVQSYQDLNLSALSTVGDVVTALNSVAGVAASIDGDGHLVVSSTDSNMGVAIGHDTDAVGTNNKSFSGYFGLNDFLTGTDAVTLAVRSDIAASSSLLSTGTLSTSSTLAVGDAGIGVGDATGVDALMDALTENHTFPAVGSLSKTSATLSGYVAIYISSIATKASQASDLADTKSTLYSSLSTSLANQAGVNRDEETAELTLLENSYAASSNIISVVKSMMDALMAMVN